MTFTIGQNDTRPPLESQLQTNVGSPVNMNGVDNVRFRMENVETKELVVDSDINDRVTITDAGAAIVEYQWQPSDTAQVGRYRAEWLVSYVDGSSESFPNRGKIEIMVTESVE